MHVLVVVVLAVVAVVAEAVAAPLLGFEAPLLLLLG